MLSSPVPHPSGTGDGSISFPGASIGGVGSGRSLGHCSDLGGGGMLHLRLEEGERQLHGRGYLAHVGHRCVASFKLRDELHLLPEQIRQPGAPPELLDRRVHPVGGGAARRLRLRRGGEPR
jgi:hypothetical protein